MEAGQRSSARHGVPRPAVDAAPGRPDRVTPRSLYAPQPAGAAPATRPGIDRYLASGRAVEPVSTPGVSAGAAQRGRAPLQQSHRRTSLPGLRAAGGRTPEVPGVGAGASGRVSGVEFGASPPGQPRSLYRLECGSSTSQYSLPGLQHAFSDSALG